MKNSNLNLMTLLTAIVFLPTVANVCAQETKPLSAPQNTASAMFIKNPELRENLLKRLNAAVAAREEMNKKGGLMSPDEAAAIMKTDRQNAAWLKSEIEKRGWLIT